MATKSKSVSELKKIHKGLSALYTRLKKIKSKTPPEQRDPRIETASDYIRAAGVQIATQF